MIGVEGQYLLKVSLGDLDDFLKEEDLISFTLIEEVGNVLPQFELMFTTADADILSYISEGNKLQISLGSHHLELLPSPYMIFSKQIAKAGHQLFRLKLVGLYDAPRYLSEDKSRAFSGNSSEVIVQIAQENGFTVDNQATTNDAQNWLQSSISDKLFVNKVWLHSWIDNSVLTLAITSDGSFLLRDIRKLATEDEKWKFVPNDPRSDKEHSYGGDYVVISETGFLNQYAGYGRQFEQISLLDSTIETVVPDISPIFGLSQALDRFAELVGKRKSVQLPVNDNVHSNYWKAYFNNLAFLSSLSSTRIQLTVAGYYLPVRPLDLVHFYEYDPNNKISVGAYSGLYVVTKVSRVITNKSFQTHIEISREVLNFLKGDIG